jgi:hypothetical protein
VPAIPNDYAERLYVGVLGKLTGVYLVRPKAGHMSGSCGSSVRSMATMAAQGNRKWPSGRLPR